MNPYSYSGLDIKIKYKPGMPKIERHGDWVDLYTSEEIVLNKFDSTIINLGVCIALPDGYEALLVPRSSTFKKFGIIQTNGVGVIDNAYRGKDDWWGMPVYATRYVLIPKHTRIAQFRILRNQPLFSVTETEMDDENRGGFGSTG